jgi:hypothetical protein
MRSNIKVETGPEYRDRIFTIHLCDYDLASLQLDRLDRAVIDSPVKEPADILQSLEIIFRRLHQQQPKASATPPLQSPK